MKDIIDTSEDGSKPLSNSRKKKKNIKNITQIENFPVALFASVMGMSGLALSLESFENTIKIAEKYSPFISGISFVMMACLLLVYSAKLILHPHKVLKEWEHPIRINFFAAISLGIVITGTSFLNYDKILAERLWLLGTFMHFFIMLGVIRSWLSDKKFENIHITPAWFVPAVGNVVIPIAGFQLGYEQISWFFFSAGMIFWLVLLSIILNRLILDTPITPNLLPTMFILVAPPAIGFNAYMIMTESFDTFAHFLYFTGLLFVLINLTFIKQFIKIPFALSWWAYSFPIAGFTISTFKYFKYSGDNFFLYLGILMILINLIIIIILTVRTIFSIIRQEIFIDD